MNPPTSRHEWRLNRAMSNGPQSYYDLFVNGQYQHVWIRKDVRTGKFYLGNYKHDAIGPFDSIQNAEESLIVMDVIARFEKAYG